MTMQEIKSVFPEYKIGIASVSDLELVYSVIGLDLEGFANLDSDDIDSRYIVSGADPVVGKAGARPMLIASFLRMYLSDIGGENLFPAEVTGEISVSELKAIMVKFGSDYTIVGDEVLPLVPVGTPSVIGDFEASDNGENAITMSFSAALGASSYDLVEDGATIVTGIRDGYVLETVGTFDYNVIAVSSDNSTDSNIDEGTGSLPVPGAIVDLNASEGGTGAVTVTFTAAEFADTYDLYVDGLLTTPGFTSGDTYNMSAGTADFMVKAINTTGTADSNIDSGTAV